MSSCMTSPQVQLCFPIYRKVQALSCFDIIFQLKVPITTIINDNWVCAPIHFVFRKPKEIAVNPFLSICDYSKILASVLVEVFKNLFIRVFDILEDDRLSVSDNCFRRLPTSGRLPIMNREGNALQMWVRPHRLFALALYHIQQQSVRSA